MKGRGVVVVGGGQIDPSSQEKLPSKSPALLGLIDGCCRMICGHSSMEVKNPILIYEYVFRPAIIQYGLWNHLRIDHGQEFVLCILVQDLLKT